jgi:hypothetical protein
MNTKAKLFSLAIAAAFALSVGPSLAKHHDKDTFKTDNGSVQVAFKGSDLSTDKAQPTELTKKQKHEKSRLDIPYTSDFFVTAD